MTGQYGGCGRQCLGIRSREATDEIHAERCPVETAPVQDATSDPKLPLSADMLRERTPMPCQGTGQRAILVAPEKCIVCLAGISMKALTRRRWNGPPADWRAWPPRSQDLSCTSPCPTQLLATIELQACELVWPRPQLVANST